MADGRRRTLAEREYAKWVRAQSALPSQEDAFVAAWKARGEADTEAVAAVKEDELTGSGWYPKPRSRVRHEVLAAIRALDEGGQ